MSKFSSGVVVAWLVVISIGIGWLVFQEKERGKGIFIPIQEPSPEEKRAMVIKTQTQEAKRAKENAEMLKRVEEAKKEMEKKNREKSRSWELQKEHERKIFDRIQKIPRQQEMTQAEQEASKAQTRAYLREAGYPDELLDKHGF